MCDVYRCVVKNTNFAMKRLFEIMFTDKRNLKSYQQDGKH